MTANVKMITAEKPSVLKVANAALRFRPAGAERDARRPAAPGAPPRAAPGERHGQGGGWRPGRGRADEGAADEGAQLTKEQEQKLDAIFADNRQQMQALSEQERAGQGPAHPRGGARARIREMLTAELARQVRRDEPRRGPHDRGERGGAASSARRVYIMDGEKLKAREPHARHQRRHLDRDPPRRPQGRPGGGHRHLRQAERRRRGAVISPRLRL
jgi:HlyD family secretion protein